MAISEAYGRVSRGFWSDPDIKRRLSAEQKALLLYYFTSPHSNMAGLYAAPVEFTAAHTGLSVELVREWTLGCLAPFVSYDEATEEVLVHRMARHQVGDVIDPKDKRLTAVNRILASAHSQALVRHFAALFPAWPIALPEAPSKPLRSPFEARAVAVTETEQEQIKEPSGADAPVAVPEVGTKVIPLPQAEPEPDGDPERVTPQRIIAVWIERQRRRPPQPVIDQQAAPAKRLAANYTRAELTAAFHGISSMFPHAGKTGTPWNLWELEKKFDKALDAAANHPEVRRQQAEREFDQILNASGGAA